MPDEFERHGRSGEQDWGRQPARSQSRAAAAGRGEGPGRKPKNTTTPKKECTASPDGMHHSEPVLPPPGGARWMKVVKCRWMANSFVSRIRPDRAWWFCAHVERCRFCANKMSDTMGQRCPEFPGKPGEKEAAERRSLEIEQNRPSGPQWQRRNVPNGRQSYRKPKSGGDKGKEGNGNSSS